MKTLLLAATLVLGPCAVAQTTFTTIGNITFGSDGSTATTIGGTTFVTGASPVVFQALGSSAPAQNATTSSTVQKYPPRQEHGNTLSWKWFRVKAYFTLKKR